MEFRELEGARVRMRAFHADDREFLYNHFNNPEVNRFLFDSEPPEGESLFSLVRWCIDHSDNHLRWCIELKQSGKSIGTCGFHCHESMNNSAEIGIDLDPEYWGKGLMSEAVTEMLDYGFSSLNLHRISALVYTENADCIRLLERNGFEREGLLKDRFLFRGKYYDHYLYSRQATQS